MAIHQAEVRRGFTVICPECREPEIFCFLHDLLPLHCAGCDAEFSVEDVEEWLARNERTIQQWRTLLAWIQSAPEFSEE